jgi:hypothetical protein
MGKPTVVRYVQIALSYKIAQTVKYINFCTAAKGNLKYTTVVKKFGAIGPS